MHAISQADIQTLSRFRAHRNAVAHEVALYVTLPDREVDVALLLEANEIIRRLGVFWARIDIDGDLEYEWEHISDADIQSGSSLFADFLIGVVDDLAE